MRKSVFYAVAALIALALIAVIFIHDAQTPAQPVALPLTKTFDQSPTGFTFKYPADWEYTLPMIGVLIMGPPQTLDGSEAGPTFTVQRAEPLSVVGTLDSALDRYLQSGPLHVSGRWQITTAAHTIQFQGRDARSIELEGADVVNTQPLHTQVIVTSAKDTFVYLFITTVPIAKKAAYDPTLNAMLTTVQILE